MDEVDDLRAQILNGFFDGRLVEIAEAIQQRVSTGEVAVRWRLKMDDLDLREDDLTLGEFFLWERMAGKTWERLKPLASAADCRALLLVLGQERRSLDYDQAKAWVDAMPAKRLLESFSEVEVTEAPFDSAD